MIKGRYIGLITVDFCVDENTDGLLPFEQLRKNVTQDLNDFIKELLMEELGDIAKVGVEQQYADLYITND